MLLDMRDARQYEDRAGALWRKKAPEPRVSHAEPLCSQGYVLCARAPDPLSPTAFLPYLYQLRDDSNVAGFLTDSEWPGLHLPTSCQPPEMQQGFFAACVLISVLQPTPPPVLLF